MTISHNPTNIEQADEAQRKYEARKLTFNGWHWPVRRPEMRHSKNIEARMIEDLRHSWALTDTADLLSLAVAGWARQQVIDHGPRAVESYFRSRA